MRTTVSKIPMLKRSLLLKAAALAAALAVVPGLAAAGGAGARAPARASLQYRHDALGVSLAHPDALQVVEDEYLLDELGFTLAPAFREKDGDSEVGMALRVVWLHRRLPGSLDAAVREHIGAFPSALLRGRDERIGGQRAVVIENAPGLVTTTYVYLEAGGRIYEIIYPRPQLDAAGWSLLATLRFEAPARTLDSLNLKYEPMVPMAMLAYTEELVTPQAVVGCVDYPTSKYLQTPFTSTANGNGYSKAGPSYYGEGLHVGCNRTSNQNDYYALDMALRAWDPVLNPTNGGTVRWAGWASGGWSSLGRTVIIDQGGGYKSLSAHLRGTNVTAGQWVNANSVIGWAGGSGNGVDNYWGNHLHQGLYLNANMSGGGTYGGQSAQQTNVHYCRNGCSNYYSLLSRYQTLSY